MAMAQRLVRTQCGFPVMNSLTQREALDVSLEDLEEHHLSLYDLCSSLDVIALRIRRAKLKAALRLGVCTLGGKASFLLGM